MMNIPSYDDYAAAFVLKVTQILSQTSKQPHPCGGGSDKAWFNKELVY